MFRDITLPEAMDLSGKVIIDIRSPGEYKEATIPGAVNIPLLDNVHRSLVGKTYKQQGPQQARHMAMEIVSPYLPTIINTVYEKAFGNKVVLFCWRGGERSYFMANILDLMGFEVYRVTGGFKAYRKYVREYLEREKLPLKAVVLYGLTGVSKTEVLHELQDEGIPVLDLEGLACHRGSVFGKIGMPSSPSQKMFEAEIMERLKGAERCGIFAVECESKRLGNLFVPSSVLNTMEDGYKLLLYSSLESRVQKIKNIYAGDDRAVFENIKSSIKKLKKYQGENKVKQLCKDIDAGKLDEVVKYLLMNYYDRLYGYPDHSSSEYDLSVNTEDIPKAVEKLKKYIYRLPEFVGREGCGGVSLGDRSKVKKCTGKPKYIPGRGGGKYKNKKKIPGSVGERGV